MRINDEAICDQIVFLGFDTTEEARVIVPIIAQTIDEPTKRRALARNLGHFMRDPLGGGKPSTSPMYIEYREERLDQLMVVFDDEVDVRIMTVTPEEIEAGVLSETMEVSLIKSSSATIYRFLRSND